MIVEITLTSMCIVYPGRKENVVKTCSTHRFGGAGLPFALKCESVTGGVWLCTHVTVHTHYAHICSQFWWWSTEFWK